MHTHFCTFVCSVGAYITSLELSRQFINSALLVGRLVFFQMMMMTTIKKKSVLLVPFFSYSKICVHSSGCQGCPAPPIKNSLYPTRHPLLWRRIFLTPHLLGFYESFGNGSVYIFLEAAPKCTQIK